ncbi:MAG: iron export ABC transporter permease subunit FetB [Halothiobacillaceae bacterium]
MNLIELTPLDLGLAALLVLILGGLVALSGLGLTRSLYFSSLRMVLQLLLIGVVLETLFRLNNPWLVGLMALVMLAVAGWEVVARQKRRLRGGWGYGIGLIAMALPAFTLTLMALVVVVGVQPWYTPQYAIPLLGMILGNTMTGIGLGFNRLTMGAAASRREIEAQLLLGFDARQASRKLRQDSLHTAMVPTINMLTVAGIVSLPGMMTGQILAGTSPIEAVKYQILLMFLITSATGFGTMLAIELGTRRLFDERQRLRLDRLHEAK